MLRAIIIDDQQIDIDNLKVLLQKHKGQLELVAEYLTIEPAIKGIQLLNPDVVFLDVELENKRTAFDLLNQIGDVDFEIIFTTAHNQYGALAFRAAAVDYLLKPIVPSELNESLDRLEFKNSLEDKKLIKESLLESFGGKGWPQSLNIKTKEKIHNVPLVEILYCEAKINYTEFHLRHKPNLTVSQTIKNFVELLDPNQFRRIHKSYVVNLRYIIKYNKTSGIITLADNTPLKVADMQKTKFNETWEDYKSRHR